MPAGAVALLLAAAVAAERGLNAGVDSATAMTRGVGVTVASGVALAWAGTVGNDCGVITAWARSGVGSVVTRREPMATATTIVTSSTLAVKSARVDVRHALSAASSFAVRSARSDARRIGVSPGRNFARVLRTFGYRLSRAFPHDARNEPLRLAVAR
jgi:hypothetical protein